MDTDNRSRQKTVRFWEALIAAAATLQQAAHSETAVFEAFTTRLVQMNLQGGILKLDPIRNTLEISALAFPERLLNILNTINSLTGLTAFGYRLPLEQAPTYQDIIDKKEYSRLATNPMLPLAALRELNGWLDIVPEYVKDYVSLNTYKL